MRALLSKLKLSWRFTRAGFQCIWLDDAVFITVQPYSEAECQSALRREEKETEILSEAAFALHEQASSVASKPN